MSRRSIWVQVLTGWVPVWGLFAALLVGVHGTSWHSATLLGLRMVVSAGVLSLAVRKFTQRLPWPRHVRPSFVAAHAAMAIVYSLTWHALNSAIESIVRGRLVVVLGPGIMAYLSAGIWLYVMIAGICYATTATERAAQAEGNAAKSQLAALRSHLHPHFLFNAMHTVVQLIPLDPARAALAAEQLAGLLRRAIEEDRDLVPVSEEWSFVKRYLALERIRFGDRLRVHVDIDARVNESLIPLFALQTLVENAVRHGAAPNIEPTDVTISGSAANNVMTFSVRDNGSGVAEGVLADQGTGLRRLRERLAVLYGNDARLDAGCLAAGGFVATLVIPFATSDE